MSIEPGAKYFRKVLCERKTSNQKEAVMHTFTPPAPFALDKDTPQSLERDLPSEGVLSVVLEVNPVSPLNAGGALSLRARNLLYALETPKILVQSVLNNLEDDQRSTRTRA